MMFDYLTIVINDKPPVSVKVVDKQAKYEYKTSIKKDLLYSVKRYYKDNLLKKSDENIPFSSWDVLTFILDVDVELIW